MAKYSIVYILDCKETYNKVLLRDHRRNSKYFWWYKVFKLFSIFLPVHLRNANVLNTIYSNILIWNKQVLKNCNVQYLFRLNYKEKQLNY